MNMTVSLNKLVNKERIVELLEEREFSDYTLEVNENNEDDWFIYFKADRQIPGQSAFHFITPKTRVQDLWWLT